MGKLIVLLCFALLAMTLVMACRGPGAPCTYDNDCCGGFTCAWKGKCIGRPGPGGTWGPGGPWGLGGPWGIGGPAGAEVEWKQKDAAQ